MSKAIYAKSAKSRATIALYRMRHVKDLGRPFDDCFEMNDGDDVVAHIIKRAHADEEIARLVKDRGYGYWLEPGYLEKMTIPGQRSRYVEEAIALQDGGRPC